MDKIFYPYQQSFYKSQARFRVVNKARQIGFSYIIAFEGAINALAKRRTSLYLSTGLRASQRIIHTARRFIRELGKISTGEYPEFEKDTQSELMLPNGGTIVSLPASAEVVRGFTADNLYIDETAHIKKIYDIVKAAAPSITRKDKTRRLTLTSTPFGKQGFFYDVFTNKNNQFGEYERFSVNIKEAIISGYPADLKECMSILGVTSEEDESFRQEYMCEFVDEAASYFTFDLINECINHDLENWDLEDLARNKNRLYFGGYDPAKVVDSGVFVIVEKTDTKIIIRHIQEWQKKNYSEQLAHIENHCRACGISKMATDQTGVGQKIAEDMSRLLGSRSEGITFTNSMKEKMIMNLKSMFQDKRIEIPDNTKLINQLHSLQREISDTTIKYSHPSGGHDDFVWALALACHLCSTGSDYVIIDMFKKKLEEIKKPKEN